MPGDKLRYSADTSFFINGWRKYYPPGNFPSIWEQVEKLIATGSFRATIEVRAELERQDDDVFEWAKNQAGLFLPIDVKIQNKISEILTQFPNLAKAGSTRNQADPFVIALAEINSCAVVSEENMNQNMNAPKIPFVCQTRSIDCIKFIDVIRREKWKF